jgi:multidrug efflux pump subunit AcrB
VLGLAGAGQPLEPTLCQAGARRAAVTRPELAEATRRAYDGLPVGLYREGDDLFPIVLRHTQEEWTAVAENLDVVQIVPALSRESVPLAAVVGDIHPEWEDPIIMRSNRRRGDSAGGDGRRVGLGRCPLWTTTVPQLDRYTHIGRMFHDE